MADLETFTPPEGIPKLDTKTINNPKVDGEEKLRIARLHVLEMGSYCPCVRRTDNNHFDSKCTCLFDLFCTEADKSFMVKAIAMAIVEFQGMSHIEKQLRVSEWIRYSKMIHGNAKRRFLVPLSMTSALVEEGNLQITTLPVNYSICLSALLGLLGIGVRNWKTFKKASASGIMKTHGNAGNNHAHPDDGRLEDLMRFFEDLKEFGCPRATLTVKQHSGHGLRHVDESIIELPTTYSKRRLFGRYCWERGHLVSVDGMGTVVRRDRTVDDKPFDSSWCSAPLEEDEEPEPIVSWPVFMRTWQQHYKELVVPRPRADICDDCFIYANAFKASIRSNGSDSDDNAADDAVQQEDETAAAVEAIAEASRREGAIAKAYVHVDAARKQRAYVNSKVNDAFQDRLENRPHSERRYVLYGDYCQNMCMPHFGSEQPGETYYFSPLTYNCFGMVDPTRTDEENKRIDHLIAHLYHEGEGTKGGNNVASLIMKTLKHMDLLKTEAGKELCIVMDNCSGQNKNGMVLRMALLLVERDFFKTVEFCFLVRGHTKNPCDRMYNLLKLLYRPKNIYTRQELFDALNANENVTVINTEADDFKFWGEHLDLLYGSIRTGWVTKNHIFRVADDTGDTKMIFLEYHGQPAVQQEFRTSKKAYGDERETLLLQLPMTIPAPGIRMIKQVELGTKYRKYLPAYAQDITCPVPDEAIINEIKEQRKKKRAAKKAAKKQKQAEQAAEAANEHTEEASASSTLPMETI